MRNTIALTADLKAPAIVSAGLDSQPIYISRRGVLISVLGQNVCAAAVTAELEAHIRELLKTTKPFYGFPAADVEKNQLSLSYNDQLNTLFIIGITDIDAGFSGPSSLPKESLAGFGVRLKASPGASIASSHVVLARLEGQTVADRIIRFYYLPA